MNELTVRRLVIEDDQGRPRAVIECGPSPDPPGDGGVSLTMLAATGDPMLVLELCPEPRLSVGHPDRGTSVILLRSEIQIWAGGNEIISVSAVDGGEIQIRDEDGRLKLRLP